MPEDLTVLGAPAPRWWAAVAIALAGACYVAAAQLQLAQAANTHFRRSDLLKFLLMELDLPGAFDADHLRGICQEYRHTIEVTAEDFRTINKALSLPVKS